MKGKDHISDPIYYLSLKFLGLILKPPFLVFERADMNKYLYRHSDGQVDWSLEGMKMLNEFPDLMKDGVDLTCRGALGKLLLDRGFQMVIPYEEYVLTDGDRDVYIYMDDDCLKVVRQGVMYNGPMHYDQGQDELCDLWEMIRKAWESSPQDSSL